MYRFTLAVALFLATVWPSGPACADSDVLVPSGNSSSSSQPANEQPSLPVLDSGAPPEQTPAPPQSSTSTSTQQIPTGLTSSSPAQVIEVPPIGGESMPLDAKLPNSLEVVVASNSVWGTYDTSTVRNMLGIAPSDISKHCHLAADGIFTGNGSPGSYIFDTGVNNDALLRYDGKLTGVSMHMEALCDLVPLPANGSYIVKMGNSYLIFLAGMVCDTPPDNAKNLTVQYAGNGAGKCVYQ